MAIEEDRPGEPAHYGEGADGFPHGSKYPLFVGGGMFFTALGLMWFPVLLIGVPLLVYGSWGWTRQYSIEEFESGVIPEQKRQRIGMKTGYLSMILVVISELLVFAAVFIAYLYLEASQGPFPPAGAPEPSFLFGALLFVVLAAGSVAMYWAKTSIQQDDRDGLKLGLIATVGSGVAFVAILAYEWVRLFDQGLYWDPLLVGEQLGAYGSAFFLMTGLHGAHVIGGLVLVALIIYRVYARDHFSSNRHLLISTTELYWHFLTFVQLAILVVAYL